MQGPTSVFDGLIRRLERRVRLGDADRQALEALPHTLRSFPAGAHFVRDGDRPDFCCLLLSGFACRYKITGDGARQIMSFHMAGEFVDLQNSLLGVADHSVQAMTECEAAIIPRLTLRDVALNRPALAEALWTDTLIDAAIFREWVVNVGRRDSRARVAHLLCELSLRMQAAGLAFGHRYQLPMTQEQLADAVGLTSVHVNRVLRQLAEEGLISRDRRTIVIEDWRRMREAGDFNDRYLHDDGSAQERRRA
ncbi:MAG TPA: Crp/Fnr family transcriptional regulator [Allosphingosinicella sp.]|jgi:CRP-like cAMP-binding protein|nr:Crp/Fnr family transcriptional regulator [Allosphingosinicella sp.]